MEKILASLIFISASVYGMQSNEMTDSFPLVSEKLMKKHLLVQAVNSNDLKKVRKTFNGSLRDICVSKLVRKWKTGKDNTSHMDYMFEQRRDEINSKDEKGNSLLMIAIRNNNYEMAKCLVSYGADIDFTSLLKNEIFLSGVCIGIVLGIVKIVPKLIRKIAASLNNEAIVSNNFMQMCVNFLTEENLSVYSIPLILNLSAPMLISIFSWLDPRLSLRHDSANIN